MQMDKGEILRSFNNANSKKKQVGILAELNAVPKDTIIDILIEQGVSEKELPKRRKPKVDKPVAVSEPKGINTANEHKNSAPSSTCFRQTKTHKASEPKAGIDDRRACLEHLEVLITALQLYKQQNLAEFDAAVARAENTAKRIDSALEFVKECMRE